MNCVFDPARFSSDWTAVLSGSRSPIYWARDLSRRTERLAMMRRACDWIEELMEVNPQICDQPLMGHSLAALTEEEPRPPGVSSAQPRKEQRPFHEPESASKRNSRNAAARTTRSSPPEIVYPPARPFQPRISNMRRIAERSQANDPPEIIYNLQPQVEGSLLRRVAGLPDDAFGVSAMSRELIPTPRRSSRTPPVLNERMKRRDWRDLMAQRTAGSLLRNWTGASHTASTATQATSPNGQKQTVSPSLTEHAIEQIVSLSLTEQWLTPLSGTQAPANTLAQLANVAGTHDAGTNNEMKRAREQAHIIPRSLPHLPEFSGWPETAVNRNQDFVDAATPGSASRRLETTLPPQPPARFMPEDDLWHGVTREQTVAIPSSPATDSWRPAYSRENVGSAPADIAPPTLTPSLPPLRPPQAPGVTALPVVAATAYQGARQEQSIAQEKDLDLLAAQIKRIIDDEARRHGIDV